MAGVLWRQLGLRDYISVWDAMRDFTASRNANTADELWLVEHPPVYTLGRNSKPEHLLDPGSIPVVPTDRGGQVTYHGPGQLVCYLLLDLRRRSLGVRHAVEIMEAAVTDVLAQYGVAGKTRREAPGVYIGEAKIASLGLRVTRGCSYHGLALNIDMDLTPFSGINPCGYRGMAVTQLASWAKIPSPERVQTLLIEHLTGRLGYTSATPAL